MSYSARPITARLDAAKLALQGALDNPEVLALLSARSYDKKALAAGKTLYEQAHRLDQQARHKRAGQFGATDAMHARLQAARRTYAEDLALARVEFNGDRELGARLDLDGTRGRSLGVWIAQVRQFYDTLEADRALVARLKPLGLNQAVLEARQAAVAALEAARVQQASARGEAQELTRRRRAAMAELDAWMRRFVKVARIALQEQPQLLEKLGITARS